MLETAALRVRGSENWGNEHVVVISVEDLTCRAHEAIDHVPWLVARVVRQSESSGLWLVAIKTNSSRECDAGSRKSERLSSSDELRYMVLIVLVYVFVRYYTLICRRMCF